MRKKQIGDLLFHKGVQTKYGKVIRFNLGTDLTHCSIQATRDKIYEMTPHGAEFADLPRESDVIRLRPMVSRVKKLKAITRLYRRTWGKYGWGQAVAIWLRRKWHINVHWKTGTICSEIDAVYANYLGENIDVNKVAPDELFKILVNSDKIKWEVVE